MMKMLPARWKRSGLVLLGGMFLLAAAAGGCEHTHDQGGKCILPGKSPAAATGSTN